MHITSKYFETSLKKLRNPVNFRINIRSVIMNGNYSVIPYERLSLSSVLLTSGSVQKYLTTPVSLSFIYKKNNNQRNNLTKRQEISRLYIIN